MCRSADAVSGAVEPSDESTVCLLLFYAAECGLKERILRRGNHRSTQGVPLTHNLRALAKNLRLPPSIGAQLDRLDRCRRKNPQLDKLAIHELHEAWRYGAKLNETDQKAAQEALRALIDWCRNDT